MRKQGKVFICFIGLDGSGKTTHALHVYRGLLAKRINCIYIRSRYELIGFLPSALQELVNRYISIRPKLVIVQSPFKNRKSLISKMLLTILLLAYTFATYLLIIKLYLRRFIIVSDRYFFDWFHNIAWSFNVVHLLPKPDLTFLLDIPVIMAFSRMQSSEDRKISLSYYESLREWYLTLAKRQNFVIIDSSADFEQTKNSIFNHVMSYLEGNGQIA